MKIRTKLSGASQETENCYHLAEDLTRMECAIRFTHVLLEPARIKQLKGIAYEDLAMGLRAIRGTAWKVRGHFEKTETLNKAKRLERTLDGVLARLKKRKKGKDLTRKEAERMRTTVDRLDREREDLKSAAGTRCKLKSFHFERMQRERRREARKGGKGGR